MAGIDSTTCSFCGSKTTNGRRILVGKNANICTECVLLCWDTINEESPYDDDYEPVQQSMAIVPPQELNRLLGEYVVGQEQARKFIAVALYNHMKRVSLISQGAQDIQKSNILLLGPTGSGKTYLMQTLAKILDLPLAIADATSLTEAGYVGEDVENILLALIRSANGDIQRAEKGIVYIDEIDKIARKGENLSITRDVSGEGVQQALLKIIEGAIVNVPPNGGRKHPHQEMLQINTKDILFVCGGAFDGLEKIKQARTTTRRSLGFGAVTEAPVPNGEDSRVSNEDLVKYGLIPEFLGRLPIIAELEQLDESALIKIMTEPKNSIVRQYQKLFETDGIDLQFTKAALSAIAEKAILKKSGARGIRSIVETILLDLMYTLPMSGATKCVVNEALVKGTGQAKITYDRQQTA